MPASDAPTAGSERDAPDGPGDSDPDGPDDSDSGGPADTDSDGPGATDSDGPGATDSDGPDDSGPGGSDPALTRTDERVLAYLDDAGTDYPAFVASNTGLYLDHVESRLDALDTAGLAERVTGEAVYRITDAGRDALRDDRAAWSD